MGTTTMPVDLFNPGQVFACLGLAEAADLWLGRTRAGFGSGRGKAVFHLSVHGSDDPAVEVLTLLRASELQAVVPAGADAEAPKGMKTRLVGAGGAFPAARAKSDVIPLELHVPDRPALLIDHWGDTLRDSMKFWAGMAGYPGAALFRDALERFRARTDLSPADWFDAPAAAKSTLGFDIRTTRTSIDVGSGAAQVRTYPVVDVLAAIGLIHARPAPSGRLVYRYGVPIEDDLPLPLLRAVLGCAELPLPIRRFRMELVRPEGAYSRFITNVHEETAP